MAKLSVHHLLILLVQCIVYTNICTTSYGQNQDLTLKANKEIVSTFINEVIDNRKLDLINNIFSPGYIFHTISGKQLNEIADSSLVSFLRYLFGAVPDYRQTIDHIVAENDMVAVNVTTTGTHVKDFLGYPPSNNKLKYPIMSSSDCQTKRSLKDGKWQT